MTTTQAPVDAPVRIPDLQEVEAWLREQPEDARFIMSLAAHCVMARCISAINGRPMRVGLRWCWSHASRKMTPLPESISLLIKAMLAAGVTTPVQALQVIEQNRAALTAEAVGS